MTTPRWIERLRAFFGGYFWMPCPLCERYFGGHEEGNGDLYVGNGRGKMVCSECAEFASVLSEGILEKELMLNQKNEEE